MLSLGFKIHVLTMYVSLQGEDSNGEHLLVLYCQEFMNSWYCQNWQILFFSYDIIGLTCYICAIQKTPLQYRKCNFKSVL